MKESNLVTLLCFKNETKFKSYCSSFNLHIFPQRIGASIVNLSWEMTIGTTRVINFSNFVTLKFAKVLNNVEVSYIVAKTS
jgi:hypothetical protein